MTLAKVAASLRLNLSAALLVTETVPSVPVVEPTPTVPEPTWTVPNVIVKTPEKSLVPSMTRVLVPEPAVFSKPAPPLISRTFLSVPERRLSAPVPEPTRSKEVPMAKPPRSSVPPLRVRVLLTVPAEFKYPRSAPRVSVPPVSESTLVAVAAALEVLARLRVVTATVPPEILRVAKLVLPVPVLAELFTFMFSVPIVTAPPLMLVVA